MNDISDGNYHLNSALEVLQFFEFEHLPQHLRGTSARFADMARSVIMSLPANPERTMALRKLLEAKDCAVRAILFKEPKP